MLSAVGKFIRGGEEEGANTVNCKKITSVTD